MAISVQLTILVLALLLPAAAALFWRSSLTAPLWGAALAFALFSAVLFADTQILSFQITTAGVDRLFHDTYYVIAYGHWFLWLGSFTAIFAALLWSQGKWLSHPYPKLARMLIWLFHLSLLASLSLNLWLAWHGIPRRYVDYEQAIAPAIRLQNMASFMGLAALAGLIALLVFALYQKLRGRSNGSAGGRL